MSKSSLSSTTGENILMVQASEGNVAEVTKILAQRKDLDVNAFSKKGETALSLAVKSGNYNVVGKLLVAGADPNLKNNGGQSPLFLASLNNYENVARILLENGAMVDESDQRGWTPLMIATYNGHVPIVNLLLDNNADASIQDCFGKRAIHRAKHETIIKLLKKTEAGKSSSPSKYQSGSETNNSKKTGNSIVSPRSVDGKSSSDFSASKLFNRSQEVKKTLTSSTSQTASRSSLNSETKKSATNKSVGTPTKSFKSQLKPSQKNSLSPNQTLSGNSIQHLLSKDEVAPIDKRVQFKEELAKIISHQINYHTQKMQTLLLQRVNYEIPTTVQGSQNSIRNELAQILNFRIASIVKSLSTHFNVKLKFCLNKAGYDTNSMQVKPFLEDEETHRLEIEPISIKPDVKLVRRVEEGAPGLEKLRKEIGRIEGEIRNTAVKLPMNDPQNQPRDENDHAFGSFGNKWEIHTQLEEYLNHEISATTQFVIETSTEKVNSVARDERNALNKKLKEELELALEYIEERIRTKLEQVIDDKVNQISESLGQGKRYRTSSPEPQDENRSFSSNQSPKKFEDSQILSMTQSQRNWRDSPKRLSPTKARLMSDLDEMRTKEADLKSSNTFHGNFEPRPSYQVEQSNSERLSSSSRQRIKNLKDNLNTNFDPSLSNGFSETTPDQGFSKTAPAFSHMIQNETTFRSPIQPDISAKDFQLSATSTDYAYAEVKRDLQIEPEVKRDLQIEPEVQPEPIKEIKETPPTTKNEDTPSKNLLSEADRQAIEERKIFYRNQLRAQQGQAQRNY